MLHVACAGCRNISPLYCATGALLHGPVLAIQGPTGAQCPFCGPMAPWFVCGFCGLQQMMFFPSLSPLIAPQWAGQVPHVAPAVEAPLGTPANQVPSIISKALQGFLEGATNELGKNVGDALGGWLQGGFQSGLPNQW
jgi:hypothetical protein